MVKLPTGMDLPIFVKSEFADFYKAMFEEQVRRENMKSVFLEYAWDMGWCDPCAADPLSQEELRELGVFWLQGNAQDAFVTRLHVRYDGEHFPEDLVFQETSDRENFQGRYALRHPWTGSEQCEAADKYRRGLAERREQEAQNLARLTGWSIGDIRRKAGGAAKISSGTSEAPAAPWYRRFWHALARNQSAN